MCRIASSLRGHHHDEHCGHHRAEEHVVGQHLAARSYLVVVSTCRVRLHCMVKFCRNMSLEILCGYGGCRSGNRKTGLRSPPQCGSFSPLFHFQCDIHPLQTVQ